METTRRMEILKMTTRIANANGCTAKLERYLSWLEKQPITVDDLEETGIGVAVHQLKDGKNGVASQAKILVDKWKRLVFVDMYRKQFAPGKSLTPELKPPQPGPVFDWGSIPEQTRRLTRDERRLLLDLGLDLTEDEDEDENKVVVNPPSKTPAVQPKKVLTKTGQVRKRRQPPKKPAPLMAKAMRAAGIKFRR